MDFLEAKAQLKTDICNYFSATGASKPMIAKVCAQIKDDAETGYGAIFDKIGDRHHATVKGFITRLQEINDAYGEQLITASDARRKAQHDKHENHSYVVSGNE